MARKITLTMLDQKAAKTTGWPLHYAADMLGVRRDRDDRELHEFFTLWLDKNKYDMSPVWRHRKKEYRIFKKGHTPHEQINTAIAEIAGNSNDDVEIDYREVVKRVKFVERHSYDADILRTFFHNMSVSWLPENTDHNYWTQYLSEDTDPSYLPTPVVPSSHSKVFKAGFNNE